MLLIAIIITVLLPTICFADEISNDELTNLKSFILERQRKTLTSTEKAELKKYILENRREVSSIPIKFLDYAIKGRFNSFRNMINRDNNYHRIGGVSFSFKEYKESEVAIKNIFNKLQKDLKQDGVNKLVLADKFNRYDFIGFINYDGKYTDIMIFYSPESKSYYQIFSEMYITKAGIKIQNLSFEKIIDEKNVEKCLVLNDKFYEALRKNDKEFFLKYIDRTELNNFSQEYFKQISEILSSERIANLQRKQSMQLTEYPNKGIYIFNEYQPNELTELNAKKCFQFFLGFDNNGKIKDLGVGDNSIVAEDYHEKLDAMVNNIMQAVYNTHNNQQYINSFCTERNMNFIKDYSKKYIKAVYKTQILKLILQNAGLKQKYENYVDINHNCAYVYTIEFSDGTKEDKIFFVHEDLFEPKCVYFSDWDDNW